MTVQQKERERRLCRVYLKDHWVDGWLMEHTTAHMMGLLYI